eukprot:GSChrysophyteH1.ASY1.ANO1.2594.1 assembled CDS
MTQRHPDFINYGNSQVVDIQEDDEPLHRDYRWRRMYKIDWKMCFLKWIRQSKYETDYHVFVEDDSFICTGNLLHQFTLLRTHEKKPSLRSGTRMYDGFDDSSTIMSSDVADFFVDNYMIPHKSNPRVDAELNCSTVVDAEAGSKILEDSIWMSWGNSWMSRFCNWKQVVEDVQPELAPLHEPYMDCLTGLKEKLNSSLSFEPDDKIMRDTMPIKFPCQPHRPLVYHGSDAAPHLLRDHGAERSKHMCEYMLLIDKVKNDSEHYLLWNTATESNYQDYSPVFLKDKEEGWLDVLSHFEEKESLACQAGVAPLPNICASADTGDDDEEEEDNEDDGDVNLSQKETNKTTARHLRDRSSQKLQKSQKAARDLEVMEARRAAQVHRSKQLLYGVSSISRKILVHTTGEKVNLHQNSAFSRYRMYYGRNP